MCVKSFAIFLLDSAHHPAHNSECPDVSDTLPTRLSYTKTYYITYRLLLVEVRNNFSLQECSGL